MRALALLVAACAGESSDCPNDLPDACPAPAPTWSGDVAPIVARTCANCHDGVTQTPVLLDQASIHDDRGPVLDQVYACAMPPAGPYALTEDERASLLGWLVCGARDD